MIGRCNTGPAALRNAAGQAFYNTSTTTLLDHVLTKISQDEQRELLESLSGEIAQRLDARAEMMEA